MDGYKNMVVIFVDLLGTKNNKDFENKLFIHRLFHGEVRTNERRNLDHVVYDRKIYSFSDCAYFFYYYKDGVDDIKKDDMKLLQIAMSNTANSLLRILNAGYLVRGGVTFGEVYFDELGFFGSAVEKAYTIESNYADVPIIALDPQIGKTIYEWEDSQTNLDLVNMLMTSRPRLIEKNCEKYFLNIFYQLETFSPELALENECINLESIKQRLFEIIARDKAKYSDRASSNGKLTIFEKLDWFEKYLIKKHNRLKPQVNGFSSIVYGD